MKSTTCYYNKEFNLEVKKSILEVTKDLRKIINICGELFIKLAKNEKFFYDRIIVNIFREYIERIDGILILMEKGSTINSKIILRSSIEIYRDLNKILVDTSEVNCYSYVLSKKIQENKKDKFFNERCGEEVKYKRKINLKELNDFIKSTPLCEKVNDVKEFKKKEWFEYGSVIYEEEEIDRILYKFLCSEVHGENSIKEQLIKDEQILRRPLRCPEDYELINFCVAHNSFVLYGNILKKYSFEDFKSKELKDIFFKAEKITKDKSKILKR